MIYVASKIRCKFDIQNRIVFLLFAIFKVCRGSTPFITYSAWPYRFGTHLYTPYCSSWFDYTYMYAPLPKPRLSQYSVEFGFH